MSTLLHTTSLCHLKHKRELAGGCMPETSPLPKSENLTNRQSSMYSVSKIVCCVILPPPRWCLWAFIGFEWHNPSRTFISPCRVLLGFMLLKDNAYLFTPPHCLNQVGWSSPWPNYPPTEINLAMLSHKVSRTILSSALPFMLPYLGSHLFNPWCVWTEPMTLNRYNSKTDIPQKSI